MTTQLSPAERRAIATLNRLAKTWPDSLWLFSGNGSLHVMKKNDEGRRAMLHDSVDPDYSIASIAIENDGGDW